MNRPTSLGDALRRRRRPSHRPFPSLLLIVQAEGLAIADPRAHDLVDVTIDDVEALMALAGTADASSSTRSPDRVVLDRLDALGLLVGRDDPVRAPAIDVAQAVAPGDAAVDRASVRAVVPSVIRLHEGRPLAWDRGSGAYRALSGAQLRILSDMVHQADTGGGAPHDLDLAGLLSVGVIERIDPHPDPGPPR